MSHENKPELFFIPAAFCTIASLICAYTTVTEKIETYEATGILFGAALAFWTANGRSGGGTPWPRNRSDVETIISAMNRHVDEVKTPLQRLKDK